MKSTEFEVQQPDQAVEQPAIDSDVEEKPVIDQPQRNSAPTIEVVDEDEEDNRPIAQCYSRCDVRPPGEWWKV